MGSWNATCGVTQLPICYGDEVALFLLVDNTHSSDWDTNGHCHSTHYWTPRTIQLYGTYDDYGGYIVEDGWNLQFIIDCFQKDAAELPKEDEYRGFEVTKEKLKNWEFILETLHEDRLMINAAGGRRHIAQMAVHRHIFDELVNVNFSHWNGAFNIASIKESSGDYIQQIKEYLETDLCGNDVMKQIIGDNEFLLFHPKRTVFGDYLEGVGERGAVKHSLYRNLLVDNLDSPELDDIVTEISKYAMFHTIFSNMRKTWMPQAGAGSQSEEHELYEITMKAVAKVIKKRKAYLDE